MHNYENMVETLMSKECKKIDNEDIIRLTHDTLGMLTEVGEFADQLKKHLFYNEPLDRINLAEELGDIGFYLTDARMVLCYTDKDIRKMNESKLRKRYPEGFTKEKAVNRDLEAERKVLENKIPDGKESVCVGCYKKEGCTLRDNLNYALTGCSEKFSGRNCSSCRNKPAIAMEICAKGHNVNQQPFAGTRDCSDWGPYVSSHNA